MTNRPETDAFTAHLTKALQETRRPTVTLTLAGDKDQVDDTATPEQQLKRSITDIISQHTDTITRAYGRIVFWLVMGCVGLGVLSVAQFVMWLLNN
jgi:hypothetical protein